MASEQAITSLHLIKVLQNKKVKTINYKSDYDSSKLLKSSFLDDIIHEHQHNKQEKLANHNTSVVITEPVQPHDIGNIILILLLDLDPWADTVEIQITEADLQIQVD
ncbi:25423_t:CDS:2 [Gigaspora margarita]|uniref:25423_t:CDS:1 n=1 Tax=Gigaspora margarita TaxID=4874 RepID=A0ABM8W3H0_GIGMA|nr:25423_t:CDS:2 [Gigaspora margarita]